MNLLDKEMIKKGFVTKTKQVQKLTIGGRTSDYPVYQIRLDFLYYNDQNARISTRISQYEQEHGAGSINKLDREGYNQLIHQFIYDSNPDRLDETQEDIGFKGQQLYGVVLKDGRIIDGNRRFTCLRNLAKEDDKFNYFEAVILGEDIKDNAKSIKKLELALQMGVLKPLDYGPIDRLVGLYKDVVETKLLTIEEYTKAISGKLQEQKKELDIAKLLVEFLEAIHAPKKYYIARDLKIDGPLRELYAALKKVPNEDQRENLKSIGFAQLAIAPESEMTPYIRKYKKLVDSRYIDEFIDNEIETADEVLDTLGRSKTVTTSEISAMRCDDELKNSMKRNLDAIFTKAGFDEVKNKPYAYLNSAYKDIKSIDLDVVQRLKSKEKKDVCNLVSEIEEMLRKIKEVADVH